MLRPGGPWRAAAACAAVLLLAWLLHPLIPPEWAQLARHFFRELLRAVT